MLKLCNSMYWLALTIWVSAIITAGIAATFAFTVLPDRDLGVRLDSFAAYDEAQHGRIAAGRLMEPIFTFVDFVSAPAAVIALAMLLLQLSVFRMPWRSPANVLRTLAIGAAIAVLAWRVFLIAPEMNRDLRGYWHAAQAGDVATAEARLAAFNVNHPRASAIMKWSLALLLVAVAASASAMSGAPGGAADPSSQPRKRTLESPKLAGKT